MLIGLNGRKQAGKDTVCLRLANLLEGTVEVERVSFADLLYESAAASLGVTVDELNEWKADATRYVAVGQYVEELGFLPDKAQTVREYLQHYGTEAHRDVFGQDFWVEAVQAGLDHHSGHLVVVTDVRFENEAQAIHDAGGAVVEVVGPQGRRTADAHASEAPLPEELIDATVTNLVRDDGFRELDRVLRTLLSLHLDAQRYIITHRPGVAP